MVVSKSQSLALGREPRVKKTTARAQQLLEEQKQRIARMKKSKAAAKAVSRPKPVDDEGDGFMYGPAESYAAPTLTDADLDHLRFDEAESKHILKLLAHRGDGDWQVQYQEGQIDLDDLRRARDNPDSNVLKRKAEGLPSVSDKGKGRVAREDEHNGDATGSCCETNYTGITIGKSAPTDASHGHEDHNATGTLRLAYPPVNQPPKTQHSAPLRSSSHSDLPRSKKPRIERKERNPDAGNRLGKPHNQPTVPVKGTATVPAKKHTAKPSYGGPQPSNTLHLKLVSSEASTHRRTITGLSNSQLNKPPINASIQEHLNQSRPDPPHQEPLPFKSNNDRLYSIPPQPRPFVYRPPSNAANLSRRLEPDLVPQVLPVVARAAPMSDDRDDHPPHKQGQPITAANSTAAARLDSHKQGGKGAPAEPQIPNNWADSRPESSPTPEPAPLAAKQHGPPNIQVKERRAKPPTPKKRISSRLDAVQGHGARQGQDIEPLANHRVLKQRGNPEPKPKPIPLPAGEVAGRRGAHHDQPDGPPVEPPARRRMRTTRSPTHNVRARRQSARGPPAAGHEDGSQADAEPGPQDDEGHGRNVCQPRVAVNITPTINSYPPDIQPIIKLAARRSKPWIIACGTFDWRVGDPGKKVHTSDAIVAHFFALACLELERQCLFRDDHVKTVNILITTYRNHTKLLIVAVIDKHGEFEDDQPEYNRDLTTWLLPDAFHEAEPESLRDRRPFEATLVKKCVASTLFGRNKFGVKHSDQFNPIPLRYLAFICAIMNHVIYCHRTGYFNKDEQLDAAQQEVAFRQYLTDLCDMQQNRPNALKQLCGSLYDDARTEASRAEARTEAPRQPRVWAPDIHEEYISQFRAGTPNPDDEEDQLPLPRQSDLEDIDEDQAERRQTRRGCSPKTRRRHGKGVQRVESSDDENDPAKGQHNRRSHSDDRHRSDGASRMYGVRHPNQDDDDDNHGEGPSRPYGARHASDDDDDDQGAGPSRPYGDRPVNDDDDDDVDLPSPRRAFLQEPRNPEQRSSGSETED